MLLVCKKDNPRLYKVMETIDDIHYEFYSLLNSFLNGFTLSRISKLFYPFMDVNNIPLEINKIITRLPEVSRTVHHLGVKRITNSEQFAVLVSVFCQSLLNISTNDSKKEKVLINIFQSYEAWLNKAVDRNDFKSKLEIITKIKKTMDVIKSYIIDSFLLGSFSTLDYTKWSDIDILLILKKNTIESSNDLLKVRRIVMKINKLLFTNDPLQHHGIFIISELDMKRYNQAFMPIENFRYSTSFYNTKYLEFSLIDSNKFILKELKSIKDNIKNFAVNNINIYDWKLFCHIVLLIPVLYLEAKGIYVYKKFSFEIARKDFNSSEWEVIETMTRLREEFYFNPPWTKVFLLLPSFWCLVYFIKLFIKYRKDVSDIVVRSKKFINAVEEKLRLMRLL